MTEAPLERVRRALAQAGSHQARDSGDWTCPAHEDHTPSLTVSEGAEGRAVLFCHAGCKPEAIVDRIGLKMPDLFPSNGDCGNGHHRDEPIATYPYRDAEGQLRYEVVRFPNKQFRQRHVSEDGEIVWSMRGVPRLPYRLPEVLQAVREGRPVYIVEGEKDADIIGRHGGVATCNSGGAGKWEAGFASYLAGANVVIVPDQDPPGTKHAADIEASLVGHARKVVIATPAPGCKDAFDHLTAGHTLAEWEALLAPRRLERVLLGPLLRSGVPEPTMVHTWLYAGGLHTLQSEPGVGKSWVALWVCMHLIAEGYAVIYLDEEGGDELIAERLIALGCSADDVDRLLFYFPFPERLWNDDDVEALRDEVAIASRIGPVGLGVFDSLPDFLALAGLSEDSAPDVTKFVHRVLAPFREVGAALLVLDHLNKPDPSLSERKRSRYARGSGAKLAKAHLTLLLETEKPFDRTRSGAVRLWKTKDRRGRVPLPELTTSSDPLAPLVLDVKVESGAVSIEEREAPAPYEHPAQTWSGPTRCMDAIEACLAGRLGQKFTAGQLGALIIDTDTHHGYRRETVFESARILAASGRCCAESGPRGSVLYFIADGGETDLV